MRKNSIKNTRINGEVQKELSNIIRNEIKDPRIGMMTSVTAAEVKYISVCLAMMRRRKKPSAA